LKSSEKIDLQSLQIKETQKEGQLFSTLKKIMTEGDHAVANFLRSGGSEPNTLVDNILEKYSEHCPINQL